MTKVLLFELDDVFGGIESFILNMLSNIKFDDDLVIDVISSKKTVANESVFTEYPINIIKTPSKTNIIKYRSTINDIIRNGGYNIIHIQKNSLTNNIPILIAEKYGVPYILHAQNSASTYNNLITRMIHTINRRINKNNQCIKFACGQNAAKWMFDSLDEVYYIKNGINPCEYTLDEEIRNKKRRELNITEKRVLCNVGRFHEQKNHDFLIEIFECYHKHDSNSILLLVGDGPLFERIKQKVKEKGLEEHVVFFGSLPRSQEREVLMASDIFLLPSLYEGVSIASVEAQMVGLPLIVSDRVDSSTSITGMVSFVSLSDPVSEWVKQIDLAIKRKNKAYNYAEILSCMRDAGYDMSYTTHCLVEMYKTGIIPFPKAEGRIYDKE